MLVISQKVLRPSLLRKQSAPQADQKSVSGISAFYEAVNVDGFVKSLF